MCEVLDKIEKRGFERGRQDGFASGQREGFASGQREGFASGQREGIAASLRNLLANTDMTQAQAMDALGICQSERAEYAAMVGSK